MPETEKSHSVQNCFVMNEMYFSEGAPCQQWQSPRTTIISLQDPVQILELLKELAFTKQVSLKT